MAIIDKENVIYLHFQQNLICYKLPVMVCVYSKLLI